MLPVQTATDSASPDSGDRGAKEQINPGTNPKADRTPTLPEAGTMTTTIALVREAQLKYVESVPALKAAYDQLIESEQLRESSETEFRELAAKDAGFQALEACMKVLKEEK